MAATPPTGHVNGAGFHPCQGVWHQARGTTPRVGVISGHYAVRLLRALPGPVPRRAWGIGFLGWNTRFRNNESWFLLEARPGRRGRRCPLDARRGRRGHRRAARQLRGRVAHGGVPVPSHRAQHHPARGVALPDALGVLGAGDLYVSLQAHPGRPEVLTRWLDPAVTDEADPLSCDPTLDMFDPANGPPYEPDFVARYRRAQEAS